ncbi:FdhD protein [Thermosyntropha lipolytica DSM 11003]|uniref:FdhD protein n=1 Tax=Thermosyntropha lipolytica DSM 11003 TaxID=1123382 RepID=A0A1M5NED2_9FIRM|nr:formate dehydrogenase accessory sulfurtransferase FdhD [Thermosyntropha lipolytica]SHG87822.1 FdhD protein [Thermosyntropha lipolytica DSM 11003]
MLEKEQYLDNKTICRTIKRYRRGKGLKEEEDYIICENGYKVWVDNHFYGSFYCTPEYLEELVIGNLAINGKIKNCREINDIIINNDEIKVFLNNSSFIPGPDNNRKGADFFVYAEDILGLMEKHLQISELHKMTGAVHVMSIADKDSILVTREDVGRHNAVDKVYGYCLQKGISLEDKLLLSSGRITHEICYKAFNMGLKFLVSRAAVTSMAVEFALAHDMTVIGFTREERFNIYTGTRRVKLKN